MNNKGVGHTAWMRRLICTFVVCIWHKTHFRMTWPRVVSRMTADRHTNKQMKSWTPIYGSNKRQTKLYKSGLILREKIFCSFRIWLSQLDNYSLTSKDQPFCLPFKVDGVGVEDLDVFSFSVSWPVVTITFYSKTEVNTFTGNSWKNTWTFRLSRLINLLN